MDPSFYESDDQKYQILMKNDPLRHEIFGDVLSVHLGLETDVDLKSDDIKYTKGFFLGRHEVKLSFFWIKINFIYFIDEIWSLGAIEATYGQWQYFKNR